MIERVARELHRIDRTGPDWPDYELEVSWENNSDLYFAMARVAVEALLDPPDNMLEDLQAAANARPGPVFMCGAVGAWVWACGVASALGRPVERLSNRTFEPAPLPAGPRAMIDAALAQPNTKGE